MNKSNILQISTLGWVYVGIALVWTVIFVSVMAFLWRHRQLPHLRIRRLPITFTALSILHLYGVLCYVAFAVGYHFPCAIEFWDMNLLLPLGIALFQIANSQFLHVASQQEKFASQNVDVLLPTIAEKEAFAPKTGTIHSVKKLKAMDHISRMVVYVGIGIVIQVIVSAVIFLISQKFHPSFGLLPANFGGTDSQVRLSCARGWEWWLSILWQLFWTWIYAPYILFKSKHIHDTYGWRLQTNICCVGGLPASPLWLCALYLDAFTAVNAVWIAPQWFVLSITVVEAATLLIPTYMVFKQHNLQTEVLATVADWEARTHKYLQETASELYAGPEETPFKSCDASERGLVTTDSIQHTSRTIGDAHAYTMNALECALSQDSAPLQQFAALKDFSGENISFLTHLTAWKRLWPQPNARKQITEIEKRALFNQALQIYAAFVAIVYADFPINISSQVLKGLDETFGVPAEALFGNISSQSSVNSATPFELEEEGLRLDVRVPALLKNNDTLKFEETLKSYVIPLHFESTIFDNAEKEIKYLVLTNTWPKFVKSHDVKQSGGRQPVGQMLTQIFRLKYRGG